MSKFCDFCKKELPTNGDPNNALMGKWCKVKVKGEPEALLHCRWSCVDGYLKKHGYSNFKKVLENERQSI